MPDSVQAFNLRKWTRPLLSYKLRLCRMSCLLMPRCRLTSIHDNIPQTTCLPAPPSQNASHKVDFSSLLYLARHVSLPVWLLSRGVSASTRPFVLFLKIDQTSRQIPQEKRTCRHRRLRLGWLRLRQSPYVYSGSIISPFRMSRELQRLPRLPRLSRQRGLSPDSVVTDPHS